MTAFTRLLLSLICITLAACSTLNSKNKSTDQISDAADAADTAKVQPRDFDKDKDTLYDLLVAEIAAQRNDFGITLLNYIQQARLTRDPEIIKRAINAAQYSKDLEAIQEMGKLWVEVEPDSIPAHQLLAFQYSLQKDYSEAVHHIDRVIELGGNARVDSLAIGSMQLPEEDKRALLQLYLELYKKHPNNYEVGYSVALIQRNLKQYDAALATLKPIEKAHPDFEPGMVLTANLLQEKGQADAAFAYTEDRYEAFPHNPSLGRIYASMLIDRQDLDGAEKVFADLSERYPMASGMKLSHALVMLENGKIEPAREELEELKAEGLHINETNFYLGRIADREDNPELAITYYEGVGEGIHFEPALERMTFLLTELDRTDEAIGHLASLRQKNPAQAIPLWTLQYRLLNTVGEQELAMQTLDEALEQFPDEESLRYARAMDYEAQNRLEEMEQDLRYIIERNPQNAVAINALGYTLADKTDRYKEALALITIALSLKPENPAIQDSMGWVLFRLGNNEEALIFIAKAYQSYPVAEVAAHLGEVLMAMDKPEEARQVWAKALAQSPNDKILTKTLERLAPDLLEAAAETDETEASESEAQTDSAATP